MSDQTREAAIKACLEHFEDRHVNLIPPCGDAMRDAEWWAAALSTTPAPDLELAKLRTIEEAARAVIEAENLIDHINHCEDHALGDLDDALEARNRSIRDLHAALEGAPHE